MHSDLLVGLFTDFHGLDSHKMMFFLVLLFKHYYCLDLRFHPSNFLDFNQLHLIAV